MTSFCLTFLSAELPDDDPMRDVLVYGIETDILQTLANLTKDKISSYNDLLPDIYNDSPYPRIREAIFRLWEETAYREAVELAREEISKAVDDYSQSIILAAIAYLSSLHDEKSLPLLLELVDNRDNSLAAAAVRAIGHIGADKNIPEPEILLTRLENSDPIADQDLYSALIVTLGLLRYDDAADMLIVIAQDSSASQGNRGLACVSLGRIGRADDYEIIESIYFESDNAMLRSYALAGLADFEDVDNSAVLAQALKRDSFWRIRSTAAEKLQQYADSEDIQKLLRYKAKNDPVKQVKIASLKSLGESGNRQSQEFLIAYFLDDSHSTETRLAVLDILAENQISGTAEAVNSIMNKLWTKDEGRFLEFTCRNLSRHEWAGLEPVFDRMLGHSNRLIVIYGIRGIRRSSIENLYRKIDNLDTEDEYIRREINLDQQ